MLGTPDGFGGDILSTTGCGSNLSRIARKLRTHTVMAQADSAAIMSRSNSARIALSSSVKSAAMAGSMRRNQTEGESVPMTLGQALAAKVRLIVWCKSCWHRVEPDVADQVVRYGADTAVTDWARRLCCSACKGREVDFVVSEAMR
jgi:hypothetical protein